METATLTSEELAIMAELGISAETALDMIRDERHAMAEQRAERAMISEAERAATAAKLRNRASAPLATATRKALTGKRGLAVLPAPETGRAVATVYGKDAETIAATVTIDATGAYRVVTGTSEAISEARAAVERASVAEQLASETARATGKRGDKRSASLRAKELDKARAALAELVSTYSDADKLAAHIARQLPKQCDTKRPIGVKLRAEQWAGATKAEQQRAEELARRDIAEHMRAMRDYRPMSGAERVELARQRKNVAAGKPDKTREGTIANRMRAMAEHEAKRAAKRSNR